MKKLIAIIIVLLILIGAVAYYGYTTLFVNGVLSMESVDKSLSEIDTGIDDIEKGGLTEETVVSIETENATSSPATSASLADIDSVIAELNSFANSDSASFGATLSDL